MSAAAVQFLILALQALPALLAAGASASVEIGNLVTQVKLFQSENRDPTAQEWATQNANLVAALSALHAAKPAA